MRTLLFLAFMAGFATLGYVYAPRLIEDNYRPTDEAGPVARAPDSGVAIASPTPIQSTVKEITRQTPEAPRVQRRIKPAAKTKAKQRHKQKRSASSGEPLDRTSSQDVERVTGMRPLNGEVKNAAYADAKPAAIRRQEPLKSRWIDDLSGAKVNFKKKSLNDSCAEAYSNCERPEAPKDLNLAGVVVKTERLVKQPKQPLEGKVEQGHYIEHTPAVYLE